MICPVCSVDISDFDLQARSSHVNSCIDMPPKSAVTSSSNDQISTEPPVIDLENDEKPTISLVNKFTCPLCGNLFFSLTQHLIKCGPKHNVSPSDLAALVDAAKIAARYSSIPSKPGTTTTKVTRKPRAKKTDEGEKKTPVKRKSRKGGSKSEQQKKQLNSDDPIEVPSTDDVVSSKYLSKKEEPNIKNTAKPFTLKNGRIVALKTLFTCDEIENRIKDLFSGTIPSNQIPNQASNSSQDSNNSLRQAFEAASFLTKESFTAKGFSKYIQLDRQREDEKVKKSSEKNNEIPLAK